LEDKFDTIRYHVYTQFFALEMTAAYMTEILKGE
jgi:hypothetical protein